MFFVLKPLRLSDFEATNNLFSFQQTIELFGFNENEIFIIKIQNFIISKSQALISHMETLNLFNTVNGHKLCSTFNNCNFFSIEDLLKSNLFKINQLLLQNIETAGIEFEENTPILRLVYPNFYDWITDYELAVTEDDGSLIDDLSTSDTKLHYPEPFVASPSFVYEDL